MSREYNLLSAKNGEIWKNFKKGWKKGTSFLEGYLSFQKARYGIVR